MKLSKEKNPPISEITDTVYLGLSELRFTLKENLLNSLGYPYKIANMDDFEKFSSPLATNILNPIYEAYGRK